MMSENEGEKYFALLKRTLSGSVGKNLIDIHFRTAQVADSPEHKLLMDLRSGGLEDSQIRERFYQKIIESSDLDSAYLILIGCDRYDVPFKSRDGEQDNSRSDETFTYLLCCVCPVKQTKASLRYIPEQREFHDGGITNVVSPPEFGFLFPAFDNRSTNIYNALYYTHSTKESHEGVVSVLFNTQIPKPAAEQKKSFEALLGASLEEVCSMDVVQTVHNELCQRIEMHKESRIADPLLVSKDDVKDVLTSCGVPQTQLSKFSVAFDDAFGFEAELNAKNIINERRFEVKTPDVSIQVSPEKADLIETRVIGGVKYILINAEENVEVNGVRIHISDI